MAAAACPADPSGHIRYDRSVTAAPTIAYELVAPALRAARALGVAETQVYAKAEVPLPRQGPAARFAITDGYALWRAADALSRQPAFGLYAASLFEPGDMELLEYVVRATRSMRDAFAALDRFYRLAHDVGRLVLNEEDDVLFIETEAPRAYAPPPAMAEWALTAWAGMMQQDFGPLSLVAVWFTHPRGAGATARAYESVLGCPVRFEAPRNAILAHPAVLSLPNKRADQKLAGVLEPVASARIESLPSADTLVGRIRAELLAVLPEGDPGMARMTRVLGMSERTLRRRIAEEGTTFARIVDDVRRALALAALADPRADIEEAALRAGFSDGTALHRAFRRWTGTTPQAYRRQL